MGPGRNTEQTILYLTEALTNWTGLPLVNGIYPGPSLFQTLQKGELLTF
jgi:hypothetical protein